MREKFKNSQNGRFLQKSFSLLILLSCIGGFIWKTWDCIDLYLEEPLGTVISTVSTKDIIFPEIMICFDGINKFYEYIEYGLAQCNIPSVESYLEGDWIGNCSDPEQVYEDNINNFIASGFFDIMEIKTFDGITLNTAFDDNYVTNSIKDTMDYGRCRTMKLNESLVKDEIIYLDIVVATLMSFRLFVINPNGFYHTHQDPGAVIDSSHWVIVTRDFEYKYIILKANFDYYESLPTKTNKCSLDENDLDLCFKNEIHEKCMSTLGCTHPFGPDKTMICTDQEKAKKASQIYQDHVNFGQSKCLRSCNYVESYLTHLRSDIRQPDSYSHRVVMHFDRKVKKFTSYITYTSLSLFAEVGGYLGIFIGAAILDIRGVIERFIFYRFF